MEVWSGEVCIYRSLTKYCLNCHLQVVDLYHLIRGSNPELPFQAVFTFMSETWNEFSSDSYISCNINFLLLVEAKNWEDNPVGRGCILAGAVTEF